MILDVRTGDAIDQQLELFRELIRE